MLGLDLTWNWHFSTPLVSYNWIENNDYTIPKLQGFCTSYNLNYLNSE